jgi:hypothetical protein
MLTMARLSVTAACRRGVAPRESVRRMVFQLLERFGVTITLSLSEARTSAVRALPGPSRLLGRAASACAAGASSVTVIASLAAVPGYWILIS